MSITYTSKEALQLFESNGTVTDSFLRRVREQGEDFRPVDFEKKGAHRDYAHSDKEDDYFEAEHDQDGEYQYNEGELGDGDDFTENEGAGLASDAGLASAIIGGALNGSGVLEERLGIGRGNAGGGIRRGNWGR